MQLTGWGGFPVLEAKISAPRSEEELRVLLRLGQAVIARGNGRAYGDSAINPNQTIEMRRLNRILAFDPEAGQLLKPAFFREISSTLSCRVGGSCM